MVSGKDMEDHFGEVGVGDTDAIQGKVGDVIYNLWEIRESNYVMIMMTTGGRLLEDDACKETVRIWNENGENVVNNFKHKLSFDCNFSYHHEVDDHNNLIHALP